MIKDLAKRFFYKDKGIKELTVLSDFRESGVKLIRKDVRLNDYKVVQNNKSEVFIKYFNGFKSLKQIDFFNDVYKTQEGRRFLWIYQK